MNSFKHQAVAGFRRWLTVAVAALLCIAIVIYQRPAVAHRPHDVVIGVELSPTYAQDQTAVIIVRNNLFKTEDGGNRWRRLVNGIGTLYQFTDLTQDTVTGQTLLASTTGGSVYRSTDGGETWTAIDTGLEAVERLEWVELLPGQTTLALAASADGELYRTTDAQGWTAVMAASDPLSAFATATDGTLWVGDMTGQLYRSADDGGTWEPSMRVAEDSISAIAALPDGTLYVGTAFNGVFEVNPASNQSTALNQGLSDLWVQDLKAIPGTDAGLMALTWHQGTAISNNRGQSWTLSNEGIVKDQQADEFNETHFHKLAFSGTYDQDSTVWIGAFNGLATSDNGGQSWQRIDTLDRDTVIAMDISPNYADDGTIAIATYVGKVMMSRDGGDTWDLTMNGIEVPRLNGGYKDRYQDPRRFFDVAFSPTYAEDDTLFVGLLWTKFLQSSNGGTSWALRGLDQELRGLTFAISPDFANDGTAFVSNQKGKVYRSTDSGESWQSISEMPWENGNDNPSLVISPSFPQDQTLFGVGAAGVYRSTDAGESWTSSTEGGNIDTLGMLKLAISPNYSADQTVYLGSTAGLYQTTDSGDSWQLVDGFADQTIEAVAVSPDYANDQTVMASVRGSGLFKSTDAGQSFTAIGDASLPFSMMYTVPASGRPLQFSPNYANDQTLFGFGAADREIYRSIDGGNTWDAIPFPDLDENAPIGLLTHAQIALGVYWTRIVKIGAFAALIGGFAWLLIRLPLSRWPVGRVRLLICAVGVLAAVGWVAFERVVANHLSAENGFLVCLGFAAVSWAITSPWFYRRFVGEATAESLAFVRIVTGFSLVVMTLFLEDLPSSALLPVEIRQPMGLIEYLYAIPGFEEFTRSQAALQGFEWITALVLIAGMVGFLTRWTLPVGAIFYIVLGGILRQYTWFYHTGLIPAYLMLALAFTPCADGLSVDRWLRQRQGKPVVANTQSSPVYGWSRYACWTILAIAYVQAGLSKIRGGGLFWWDPENLKAKVLATTLEPLQSDWTIALDLVQAPSAFFAMLGIVGLFGELTYGLVLFSRWARLTLPALMASVHIGILFLQNILFLDLVFVQILFYDYTEMREAVQRWADKRGWINRQPPTESPLDSHDPALPAALRENRRPKFKYAIIVSVLVTGMAFIWVKHREYYPFTALQMFSGRNDTGIIGYNRLIAHYDSGEVAQVTPNTFIYPPMNTRYRGTFRDCHAEDPLAVTRCNKLLQAFGDVYNPDAPEGEKITKFEVQAWVWNYRENPTDEDHGELQTSHEYPVIPTASEAATQAQL